MGNSLLIDVAIAVFLLLSAFAGSNTGLIRSLFGLIRLLVAYIGAAFIAKLLTPIVSVMFFYSGIQGKISTITQSMSSNILNAASSGATKVGSQISQASSTLSSIAQKAGLPKVLAESLGLKFSIATPKTGENLLDVASRIVSENIAYIVVFLLTFVIILIVVSFFTGWMIGLIRFITPRSIDRFFGFFFGILVGGLWVFLFFQFTKIAMPALYLSGGLFAPDVIKNSLLVPYFTNPAFFSFMPEMFKRYLVQGVS
ncbi:MAG: CvpA family protein [Clostridiales bacterium]|nr:CvpA family protein [Clostridiales bacterium]